MFTFNVLPAGLIRKHSISFDSTAAEHNEIEIEIYDVDL